MTDLRSEITALFNRLERLAEIHEELEDTEVRETLHEVLTYYFVWGKPMGKMPISYGMFTPTGDGAVAAAVNRFLAAALPLVKTAGIEPGQARLDLLQDETIETKKGEGSDTYIGWSEVPWDGEKLRESYFELSDYPDFAEESDFEEPIAETRAAPGRFRDDN